MPKYYSFRSDNNIILSFFCHKYSYEMDSLEVQCQMNLRKREPDELCNGAFIAHCNLGK